MFQRAVIYLAPLVVFTSFAAIAHECTPYKHEGGSFLGGEALLGSKVRANEIPAGWTPGPNCLIDEEHNYIDCEFVDGDGIAFVVFGDIVTRKELRAEGFKLFGALPFGLSDHADLEEIVRSQIFRDPDFPPLYVDKFSDGRIYITTDTCLENGSGEHYGVYFEIGINGVLSKIGARTNW